MIGNSFANDFFAAPKKAQTKKSSLNDRHRLVGQLNFFSNDSECDTESSDLESIISDGQDYDTNQKTSEIFRPVSRGENPQYPDMKLQSAWDVYFLRNDVDDWNHRLVYVTTFDTIKGFWAVYQHMKLPSHLPQGCDYMIFRSGIVPCWENDDNINGGRWMCELDRAVRNEQLDAKWLETLLAIVGEQLDDSNGQINGAVVQSRKKIDRISIWTRDCENDYETKNIGHRYHALIKSDNGLKFQTHESNTNRNSSSIRYRHVIYNN